MQQLGINNAAGDLTVIVPGENLCQEITSLLEESSDLIAHVTIGGRV